jgi:hypothetical protein
MKSTKNPLTQAREQHNMRTKEKIMRHSFNVWDEDIEGYRLISLHDGQVYTVRGERSDGMFFEYEYKLSGDRVRLTKTDWGWQGADFVEYVTHFSCDTDELNSIPTGDGVYVPDWVGYEEEVLV